MYRALYEFGVSHPEASLPPGCAVRTLAYVVELDASGGLVGVRRSESPQVVAPNVVGAGRGSGISCNAFVEKASISLRLDDGEDDSEARRERLDGRRELFLDYFREGAAAVSALGAVVSALTDPVVLEAIQEAAVAAGVTSKDAVGFAVDGELVSGMRAVVDWWSARTTASSSTGEPPTALDVVTGEPCVPARLFKPLQKSSAGGGQSSGSFLISFNQSAFESFGARQGANCPMSPRTAEVVMDAAEFLAARAPLVAGVKFLHWYDRDVRPDDDVLGEAFFGNFRDDDGDEPSAVSEGAMNAAATRLVRSPLSGRPPAPLAGSRYHVAVLRPVMSRISVPFYAEGSYEELYENLASWFGDMSLVSASGAGLLPPRSFAAVAYGLLTKRERESLGDKFASLRGAMPAMWRACLAGGPLPDAVLGRALRRVRSDIYEFGRVGGLPVQMIKAWLLRRPGGRDGGSVVMADLSPDVGRISYHCGRLLAIYSRLQVLANGGSGSTVLSSYYVSCSQSPASVLGRLQGASVYHFRKIRSARVVRVLEDALRETWASIGSEIPTRLPVVEQAYFAVGYWHEDAELSRRLASSESAGGEAAETVESENYQIEEETCDEQ